MIENLPIYNQGTTIRIVTTIADEASVGIPTGQLDTLKATLYDRATGAIINERDQVDILNTGGGSYADGDLALKLSPEDSPHLGGARIEEHILLLEWTYNAGVDGGKEEILLRVRDVGRV